MKTYRFIKILISFLFFLSTSTGYSRSQFPIEFFASNNTKEINLETAYIRLTGSQQSRLENSIIALMQKNHIEQGKFEDILGTYRMSSNNNITADNTEHFITSPYQHLSDEKIFSLAKKLAIVLQQESIAVFIPNLSKMGGVSVRFRSRKPGINEIVSIIHEKLPDSYNQAFSLHLVNTNCNFIHARVSSVEWLGANVHLEEISQAFPLEQISFHYGTPYLISSDGQIKPL